MLSYTFVALNNKSYTKCADENYASMTDLFASILLKGIKSQLKRGVIREYNQTEEITHNIRGKIDITKSINANYTVTRKLSCNYDELTIDSKPNQIIKATLKLLHKNRTSTKNKREINSILMFFAEVSDIKISEINWNIHFNSTNKTYRFLITMCNLVVYGLDNIQVGDSSTIENFFDSESMEVLFKQFVIEYYKRHYKLYRVHSPRIEWNIQGEQAASHIFPDMRSDLFISNYEKKAIFLIQYNKNTFDDEDIFKLYSMVKNVDANNTGDISGVLLIASSNNTTHTNEDFTIGKNKVLVRTIDLNLEFTHIQTQLESTIKTLG